MDAPVGSAAAAATAGSLDPEARFDDPFMDNLVGEWKVTMRGPGEVGENTLQAQWVLHHQFLELHLKDVANPPQYEALVHIGYSHADKKYVAHWCDTFGGKLSAVGYGQRSGDSIEFRFEYPDGPFFNTFSWDAQRRRWSFRMESTKKNGERVLFAEDTLTRP